MSAPFCFYSSHSRASPGGLGCNTLRGTPLWSASVLVFFATTGRWPTLVGMERRRQVDCTLLIPRELLGAIDVPLARVGNFIDFLIRSRGESGAGRKVGRRLTARYQQAGSDLVKVNFRVSPAIWHQLGCYARVHEVSRCRAFVLLLRLHIAAQSEGTPTIWSGRKRFYLLCYDLVRIAGGTATISRRRKYVDEPNEARLKRIYAEIESKPLLERF